MPNSTILFHFKCNVEYKPLKLHDNLASAYFCDPDISIDIKESISISASLSSPLSYRELAL